MPTSTDLNKLEKDFFNEMLKYRKNNNIKQVENKLLLNNINFITRSELYCDYTNKKCPLIKNNKKLYKDYGHITNNGAKYFSNKAELIIKKLLNN